MSRLIRTLTILIDKTEMGGMGTRPNGFIRAEKRALHKKNKMEIFAPFCILAVKEKENGNKIY